MTNALQNFKLLKYAFVLLFTSLKTTLVFGCDICSTTSSSGSTGFGTLSNKSFIGVKYHLQNFESKSGIFSNALTNTETFNTYQIWGQIPVTKTININMILPYLDLQRTNSNATEHINGFGDASVMGWYKLGFKKALKKNQDGNVNYNSAQKPSNHNLNFGLGVKLPTGKFDTVLTHRLNPGFQLGTGSFDALTALMHTYNNKRFGLNNTLTYTIKTENKNQYKFGNQFSAASNAYYIFETGKTILTPFIGVNADVFNSITQFNETLKDTNGYMINTAFGGEFTYNNFIVGANYTLPIQQNLLNKTVRLHSKFSVYVNYML